MHQCHVALASSISFLFQKQFSDLMYPPTAKDDSSRSHVPSLAAEHDDLWKMKYEKLEEQYKVMKDRNEELEDRLLNLVEKVEQEKIILSNEIDQLVGRLTLANNRISSLEDDCARYKRDCVLAVNLLHCEPFRYIPQEKAPDVLPKKEPQKTLKVVRSFATFPPMAIYLPDDSDLQPDDPAPQRADKQTAPLTASSSFTSEFVEKIKNDEHYSCVDLKRCPKCDTVQTTISRETQTIGALPPWPKFVGSPARFSTDVYPEQVI